MRYGFVHAAELELDAGADERTPGGAVTVALCGHWEHEGTCRWPHNTAVEARSGRSMRLRTVFVCDPDDEQPVRLRIVAALTAGSLDTGSRASAGGVSSAREWPSRARRKPPSPTGWPSEQRGVARHRS